MMYPILCKVQYEVLHRLFSHRGAWKQIGFSVFVNWVVAPLFMVCTPTSCPQASPLPSCHGTNTRSVGASLGVPARQK